ncbi:MAG: BMC domain-containing protein, partial [Patescibacteria group bacterium]|nr:BMC domain-containing protein [Patescibacteria group bacterium]
LKKAPIHLLQTGPVSGGKYLILFSGSEEPVNLSYQHGIDILGEWLTDSLYIPNIHPQVVPTMQGIKQVVEWDAVGVVETRSVAATIIGADTAAKNALVELTEIQLAQGIDGKGYFVFTGSLDNVEAAIESGSHYAKEQKVFINSIIIPNPEKEFYMHMA